MTLRSKGFILHEIIGKLLLKSVVKANTLDKMYYKKNTVPSSIKVMFQSRQSADIIF